VNEYIYLYLKNKKTIVNKELLKILYQIIRGLNVLHENHYIHRDIKLLNILVSTGGLVKIADFGISKKEKGLDHSGILSVSADKNTSITVNSKSVTQIAGTLFCFIYLFIFYFVKRLYGSRNN
jgi:serine/threonine protein kinase